MSTLTEHKKKQAAALDTLRLTEAEFQQIICDIDVAAALRGEVDHGRRNDRIECHGAGYLTGLLPGERGGFKVLRLRPLDVSVRGVGFLNGRYMYPDTRMMFVLERVSGGGVRVPGVVRHCTHLTRHVHRIGVEFLETVKLDELKLARRG
ncbi:MAG: hypothetical protein AAGE65_10020 [Planctomycetota bacterium]